MKIHVLSDLHLENSAPEAADVAAIAQTHADLVVLAGDIHNHAHGLRWAARAFDAHTPVVYVPGNHEYYGGEFGALNTAMHDAARATHNVHFLDNAALVDPAGRWRVLGTTLWTDFALFSADRAAHAIEAAKHAAKQVMLDFKGLIQLAHEPCAPSSSNDTSNDTNNNTAENATGNAANTATPSLRDFTPDDALALHAQSLAWLKAQLATPFAGHTIVATHHAPHRQSLALRYARDLVSAGFISDLDALVRAPVALWAHGHTHTSFDYMVNGTRVVCNPRGYRNRRTGQMENNQFAWNKIVEI